MMTDLATKLLAASKVEAPTEFSFSKSNLVCKSLNLSLNSFFCVNMYSGIDRSARTQQMQYCSKEILVTPRTFVPRSDVPKKRNRCVTAISKMRTNQKMPLLNSVWNGFLNTSFTTRQLIWFTIFIRKYVKKIIVFIVIFGVGTPSLRKVVVIKLYGSSKKMKVPKYKSRSTIIIW